MRVSGERRIRYPLIMKKGDSSPVQRVLQETQIPGRDAVIDRVGEDGGHGVQDDDKKDGNTAQTIQIGNPMFHNMLSILAMN